MSLEDHLRNEPLRETLARHLEQSAAVSRETFDMHLARLSKKRLVVSVIGLQGTGKSTFLNAICWDEPVLPIDVLETTCVPVEIAHADPPTGEAVIHFSDGRTEVVPATEDSLNRYVHNEQNRGNERGVHHIALTSDCPALANGVVLVDLPGVGSLTAANQATTEAYLSETTAVLFLLRTTPPLTRRAATCLRLVWPRVPIVLFVQNGWSDEDEDDVEDGRDAIVERLTDLAKRCHLRLDGEPAVTPIWVQEGWVGRLKQDADAVEGSGLGPFVRDRLMPLGDNWRGTLRSELGALLRSLLDSALAKAEARLAEQQLTADEVREKIARGDKEFAAYAERLDATKGEFESKVQKFESEAKAYTEKWRSESRRRLRNEMRSKMRAGMSDGPRLTRALRDEQDLALDELFGEVQQRVLDLEAELVEVLDDVPAWSRRDDDPKRTVVRPESRKYESILPTAGSAAGGVAGGLAGAKVGAAALSFLGPAGAVIGGVAGGLLGAWLGNKAGGAAQQGVRNVRANAAERVVFPAIDAFTRDAKTSAAQQLGTHATTLRGSLDAWIQSQHNANNQEREEQMRTLRASSDEKEARVAELESDCSRLSGALRAMEEDE